MEKSKRIRKTPDTVCKMDLESRVSELAKTVEELTKKMEQQIIWTKTITKEFTWIKEYIDENLSDEYTGVASHAEYPPWSKKEQREIPFVKSGSDGPSSVEHAHADVTH